MTSLELHKPRQLINRNNNNKHPRFFLETNKKQSIRSWHVWKEFNSMFDGDYSKFYNFHSIKFYSDKLVMRVIMYYFFMNE